MLTIRPEQTGDAAAVREVNTRAFGRASEADLVDLLRQRGGTTLSLVGVIQGRVVGHVLFTPVTIESPHSRLPALGLGPVAVLPEFQKRGIGSSLIRAGLEQCRQAGHEIVVVLGHPEYYPRFGFGPSLAYGVRFEQDVPEEAFMLLELRPGALAGQGGVVKYRPEFLGV